MSHASYLRSRKILQKRKEDVKTRSSKEGVGFYALHENILNHLPRISKDEIIQKYLNSVNSNEDNKKTI